MKLSTFNCGKGCSKFNSSLLKDIENINKVKETIIRTKHKYAVSIYNFENIADIIEDDMQYTINDQLLLLEIRGTTISYASFVKK